MKLKINLSLSSPITVRITSVDAEAHTAQVKLTSDISMSFPIEEGDPADLAANLNRNMILHPDGRLIVGQMVPTGVSRTGSKSIDPLKSTFR